MAPRNDNSYEKDLVSQDRQNRTILNDTLGPSRWLGESARDLEEYVKSLRPVDHAFLDRASPKLHVVRDDYANAPIEEAFNWDEVAQTIEDQEGDWYIVAFRSVRRATADNGQLFDADAEAQIEAIQSGGLLNVSG